jgi:hypothetical protein
MRPPAAPHRPDTREQPRLARVRAALRGRRRLAVALLLPLPVVAAGAVASPATAKPRPPGRTTVYVEANASGGGDGSTSHPYRDITRALEAVRPGGTVYIGPGTYHERVAYPRLTPGTASHPVTVRARTAERPVIEGVLWLKQADYWHLQNLRVTWSSSNKRYDHMMKMSGGTGWSVEGSELWGARSYAALLVAGDAQSWTVAGNSIHDTLPTNGKYQDHLIYVNSRGSGGVIAHNQLRNSLNGRAVKVGPSSAGQDQVSGLVIRDNVMDNNVGPSNIQLAWQTSNVEIYGNTMSRSRPGRPAVTAFELRGRGNVVHDNVVWQTAGTVEGHVPGLVDGGGNVVRHQ